MGSEGRQNKLVSGIVRLREAEAGEPAMVSASACEWLGSLVQSIKWDAENLHTCSWHVSRQRKLSPSKVPQKEARTPCFLPVLMWAGGRKKERAQNTGAGYSRGGLPDNGLTHLSSVQHTLGHRGKGKQGLWAER